VNNQRLSALDQRRRKGLGVAHANIRKALELTDSSHCLIKGGYLRGLEVDSCKTRFKGYIKSR